MIDTYLILLRSHTNGEDGVVLTGDPTAAVGLALYREYLAQFADWDSMTPDEQHDAMVQASTYESCELARREALGARVHSHHTAKALIDRML